MTWPVTSLLTSDDLPRRVFSLAVASTWDALPLPLITFTSLHRSHLPSEAHRDHIFNCANCLQGTSPSPFIPCFAFSIALPSS